MLTTSIAQTILLAHVLERAGERLRRCARPDCGRMFVRVGKIEYCSPKCSQALRSAKHYQAQRETILAKRAAADAAAPRPRRVQPCPRLQRIATEVVTGRVKTAQVRVQTNKNARQTTRGKRRA